MTTTRLTFCLLATVLGTAPALAQTAPATSPPAATTTTTAPSTAMPGGSGQFMTNLGRDQIRASKLVGVNIYGPDNERVGDVNDVILDRSGNAAAVVIGVGGFLGIGEKDVAVPYRMVEWSFTEASATSGTAANTNAGTGMNAGTSAGTGTGAGMTTDAGTAPGAPTTATTRAGTANTGAPAGSGNTTAATTTADQGYPTRGTIRMSRADLQNAPSFTYAASDNPANRPQGDRPAGAPSPNAPAMSPGNTPPTQRP